MSAAEKPIVKIYVRLGDGGPRGEGNADHRRISFRIPNGINPLDFLDQDFAIDGNEAVATITEFYPDGFMAGNAPPYEGPFGVKSQSLSGALATSQRKLVTYLRERGFEPQFA